MAAPLPVNEGDRDAQASPARSSLRGLAEPAGASSAPMAQVAPEVLLPTAAPTAVGVRQTPPQDAVAALPPSPPTPELLEADPCSRLSGFKYGRRLLEPASDDL